MKTDSEGGKEDGGYLGGEKKYTENLWMFVCFVGIHRLRFRVWISD